MLSGLITTKYVAVIIGPEGMAYVGQFSNVIVLITLLATGACATGIVKYISEYKDLETRRAIVANAFIISAGCLLITSILVISCSDILAQNVFNAHSFWDVFLIYGLMLIFPTFNMLAIAVFNGLQQIRLMATMNIIAACLNVITVIAGAKLFGLKGVLLANVISAFFSFFIYFYFFNKYLLLPKTFPFKLYNPASVKLLLGFSLMNVVSGIIAPALQLFVRTKLLHNFDANTAGLWQANTRLSDYYLSFIYTVIGIYYLPRLSEIQNTLLLKKEIRMGFLRILPPVILLTLGIWFCRELIVKVFLTDTFTNMLVLLKWQLIGDVIKIASWLLGYLLIAKAMKKLFIGTELVFSATFIILNLLFINEYGMIGTVYAFALNYFLYLITLVFILRKYIF